MTYTIEMARKLLDDAGCAFLQTERGKCLKSMVEQLAEANAHATRLQDRLAEVQAEKSDALIVAVERLTAVTAERDALKAELAHYVKQGLIIKEDEAGL